MPTYDYKCNECKYEWEEEQRISDEPLKLCPKCSKESAVRQISAGTNFILAGGGWARDNYK